MSEQYAVYAVGQGSLVIDVQSDLVVTGLGRVVIPMVPLSSLEDRSTTLNPIVSLGDEVFVLLTQTIATVPLAALKKKVGYVPELRDDITRALDILFHGV